MVDTWDSLFRKLEPVVKSSVVSISRSVRDLLKEKLLDMWYDKNKNYEYERTYELLNSIVTVTPKKEGKYSYSTVVTFDNGRLESRGMQDNTRWTQHSNMSDGGQTWIDAGSLAWILDEGANTPFYDFQGVHYVDATLKALKDIRYEIEQRMRDMGYEVKVYF